MLYWPEEFLLKVQQLSLWGSDSIFMSLLLLLLMFVFLCLNFQCLVKILVWDVSLWVHPVCNILLCWDSRSYFLPPFNGGFQLLSLEEFSKAPGHLFFFFLFSFPFFLSFFFFFPFGLFHVDILTVWHLILSKNYQSF